MDLHEISYDYFILFFEQMKRNFIAKRRIFEVPEMYTVLVHWRKQNVPLC